MKRIILNENRISLLLSEMISDVVYHFTDSKGIFGMFRSGKMSLTLSTNQRDSKDQNRLFYLSCSRTKFFGMGYSESLSCRLTLDGYQLKTDGYNGRATDYFGAGGKRKDLKTHGGVLDTMSPEERLNRAKTTPNFEFEDRIMSYKPYIPFTNKYVKRIDIVSQGVIGSYDVRLLKLAQEKEIPIFFFCCEEDANKGVNCLNDDIIEFASTHDCSEEETSDSSLKAKLTDEQVKIKNILRGLDNFYMSHVKGSSGIPEEAIKKFKLEKYINAINIARGGSSNLSPRTLYNLSIKCPHYVEDAENVMRLAQYIMRKIGISYFEKI